MTRRAQVKVKKKAVTRAEAAAQFERNKQRQRRRQWHRRILLGSLIAIGLYVVIGSWWLVHTGRFDKGVESANAGAWQWTANMGFKLNQIQLSGRKHADAAAIKQAIGMEKGAPILESSLAEMKERLQAIPEIKTVSITRTLPGTLTIAVTERTPAAWWQSGGNVKLIDRDGVVLTHYKYNQPVTLPVVVGLDAPKNMPQLMAILDTVPSLKPDVKSATRVGSRRWNIQLTRDITVLLPEDEPVAAWKRFAGLVEQKALLSKAIRSVDMRVEDR
jgi:cell division protein FtsQ